jgi:hypothetical protein
MSRPAHHSCIDHLNRTWSTIYEDVHHVVVLLVLFQSFRLFGRKLVDIRSEMNGQDSVKTKCEKNFYVRILKSLKMM